MQELQAIYRIRMLVFPGRPPLACKGFDKSIGDFGIVTRIAAVAPGIVGELAVEDGARNRPAWIVVVSIGFDRRFPA